MMVAGAWPGASAHRFTVGIPFMLTIAASAVGLVLGDRKPCVTEIDIDLANLPKEADGVTLIHISDVHVGSLVGERKVRRLVAQLNALQPDIVVITGDLVDERPSNLGASLNALTELRPRIGTYAVTGNHEFYAGIAASVAWMKRAGIVVLSNEVVEPIEGLLLAGFHDPTGIRWDDARFRSPSEEMTRVLSARDGDKPTVVLYHQPVWIEQFAKLGVSLLLCGHTHGGQLWPFRYLTALRYRHTQGLYEEGDLRVYVCRGTATWGPPMRLPQPAEIVRFHLRSAS